MKEKLPNHGSNWIACAKLGQTKHRDYCAKKCKYFGLCAQTRPEAEGGKETVQ